jgi:hypothetical protein
LLRYLLLQHLPLDKIERPKADPGHSEGPQEAEEVHSTHVAIVSTATLLAQVAVVDANSTSDGAVCKAELAKAEGSHKHRPRLKGLRGCGCFVEPHATDEPGCEQSSKGSARLHERAKYRDSRLVCSDLCALEPRSKYGARGEDSEEQQYVRQHHQLGTEGHAAEDFKPIDESNIG